MPAASTLTRPAISEDLLREIEEALGEYHYALDTVENDPVPGCVWFMVQKHGALEALCIKAGMRAGQSPEAFAKRVIAALATVGGV